MTDAPRYLEHVTLQTGDTRRSWREEVTDEALAVVSALLDRALAGGQPTLPVLDPPATLRATAEGSSLLVTVSGPPVDLAGRRVAAPLVTLGVATHSRGGARLWRLLHDSRTLYDLATDPGRCPPEPWCAARLEPGLATLPADRLEIVSAQLGDLGRVIAWAWLSR